MGRVLVAIIIAGVLALGSAFQSFHHPSPCHGDVFPRWHRQYRSPWSPLFGFGVATSRSSSSTSAASVSDSQEGATLLDTTTVEEKVKRRPKQSEARTQHRKPVRRSNNGKRYKGSVRQRCSRPQNKKRRVRHLYSKARSLEKRGMWREASKLLESILELDPTDAHSYLALARLESRRERGTRSAGGRRRPRSDDGGEETAAEQAGQHGHDRNATAAAPKRHARRGARQIFQAGTARCPASVHLWHAWAMHEQSYGDTAKARELLDQALELDPWNGYVCHAYGMLEMQSSQSSSSGAPAPGEEEEHVKRARQMWQRGLTYQPSAALVCSLGQLYITSGHPHSARELYSTYLPKLTNGRERIEVSLAASSLEETVFRDIERASNLLKEALLGGGGNETAAQQHDSRAYVALARLGTSGGSVDDLVVKKRLKEICVKQYRHYKARRDEGAAAAASAFPVKDGRLFNAWARLEAKANRLQEAHKILRRGREMYPRDHTLWQAAGNIEERWTGNVTAARELYSASLHLEPSAPTLIAYAMLELRSPEEQPGDAGLLEPQPNVTRVRQLFDEALLLDPKHGPAYNALGNLERREGNYARSKQLYEDGIAKHCTDAPSVYHGLAKLHLSLGEVEAARIVLRQGLSLFDTGRDANDNNNNAAPAVRENVAFLAHTLALIELNCNNNAVQAKEALKQGLWHCRNSPQLLLAMGFCESRLGNANAARNMFERSLTADQSHAQAWQAYGVMEMQAGNFRTAKTLFECGLKNSPTHGALWQAYGTLESWKGHLSNARLLFAAGIQKCPQHVPLYQAWACMELRSGDIITAKRLIGEALTKDKSNGSGWLLMSKIEEKMNNDGLVNLILRRGIECAPRDTELYRALAKHESSRGKIDSARQLLEKGIEINPLNAPLYHSLAELEARVFNIEGLAKLNKRTAEIFPSDAMSPPPSSAKRMQAQQSRSANILDGKAAFGITALAERIGMDSDISFAGGALEDVDPESLVNSMCDGLMFQDMPDVGR